MFGTMARIKVKPGQEQALRDMQTRWWRERKPKIKGPVTGYMCKPVGGPPDELLLFVVFDTKENYFATANDPEQNTWYQEFRSYMTADPVWTDVDIEEAPKD